MHLVIQFHFGGREFRCNFVCPERSAGVPRMVPKLAARLRARQCHTTPRFRQTLAARRGQTMATRCPIASPSRPRMAPTCVTIQSCTRKSSGNDVTSRSPRVVAFGHRTLVRLRRVSAVLTPKLSLKQNLLTTPHFVFTLVT